MRSLFRPLHLSTFLPTFNVKSSTKATYRQNGKGEHAPPVAPRAPSRPDEPLLTPAQAPAAGAKKQKKKWYVATTPSSSTAAAVPAARCAHTRYL